MTLRINHSANRIEVPSTNTVAPLEERREVLQDRPERTLFVRSHPGQKRMPLGASESAGAQQLRRGARPRSPFSRGRYSEVPENQPLGSYAKREVNCAQILWMKVW